MGLKKRVRLDLSKNTRLDFFFRKIEQQQSMVHYVEELTFEALKQKSQPQLRLAK